MQEAEDRVSNEPEYRCILTVEDLEVRHPGQLRWEMENPKVKELQTFAMFILH